VIPLLATLLTLLAPQPTPIGPGVAYRPQADRPVVACASKPAAVVHVELFANRRAIVIPAGIGSCADPLRTRTPTGIVELARRGLVLADLFRIWRQPLGAHTLLSFRSYNHVHAYVNGRAVRTPVGSIALEPGAEIVLELGGYVPPHVSFLFPRSLR
jgi:hypothetical protein